MHFLTLLIWCYYLSSIFLPILAIISKFLGNANNWRYGLCGFKKNSLPKSRDFMSNFIYFNLQCNCSNVSSLTFFFCVLVLLRRTSFLTTFYGLYFGSTVTDYRLQFIWASEGSFHVLLQLLVLFDLLWALLSAVLLILCLNLHIAIIFTS